VKSGSGDAQGYLREDPAKESKDSAKALRWA
jgi:hypothetical protein